MAVIGAALGTSTCVAEAGASRSEGASFPWPERPNILWLVAEDLGPYLPPFGDQTVATPHLSRLAEEGVRYPNVFSPSGVCAPSRAAIATGMYPSQIGAQHMRTGPWAAPQHAAMGLAPPIDGVPFYEAVPPPEVRMHSELLRGAGYYTANNAKEDYQFRPPASAWHDSSQEAHWRDREPGQPFFAVFNLGVTHESQIWAKADDPLQLPADAEVPVPPYLPRSEVALRDVRRMYSNIVEMDRRVGELLAELESDGLLEQTIVVWYTDHGGPLPRQKRLLYDSGLRAPMIIRFPEMWRAGEVDDRLISFVDLKPTLLEMAGVSVPGYVVGRNFVSRDQSAGSEPPERRFVHAAADRFDEHYDASRAVRDSRYKYIRHLDPSRPYYLPLAYRERMPIMQELLRLRAAGELDAVQALWFRPSRPAEELFDTVEDPHEVNDLADDPAYASKLAELRAECDRWMAEIGDDGGVGRAAEMALVRRLWSGTTQPQTRAPRLVARTPSGSAGDEPIPAAREIEISSPTQGASIVYRVSRIESDGESVTSESGGTASAPGQVPWQLYTEPLLVAADQVVQAQAHRLGFLPSPVESLAPPP